MRDTTNRYTTRAFFYAGSKYAEALKKLTPREVEILEGVAAGRTSAEIGSLLNISYRTVQKYRENICAKLGIEGYRALFNWCSEHMNNGRSNK